MSGVASDVEGTFSATINWNTVSDKSIVIPTIEISKSSAWVLHCLACARNYTALQLNVFNDMPVILLYIVVFRRHSEITLKFSLHYSLHHTSVA